MKNAVAHSTFKDIYCGIVPVSLVPFKTKRRGETVTRYRWEAAKGGVHCGFASPFSTIERAIAAASAHALMGPVSLA